jgi:hypothetical protein
MFNYYDDKYIRPIFVYKYSKIKKRMNFEFEDVLKEYQKIEEELNGEESDEQEHPEGYLELSNEVRSYFVQSRMGRPEK